MPRDASPSLWSHLRAAWLQACAGPHFDPRPAEEAGPPAAEPPRTLSPLVGTHLR